MDNEKLMYEGQLQVVKRELRDADTAAIAARAIVRMNLNEFEDDIVLGCDTEAALAALRQLHSLRAKIITLRDKRNRLAERLGHE